MVTETMVLVALRQRNWNSASMLIDEMCLDNPSSSMKTVRHALRSAPSDPVAAQLLSIWSGIRWKELGDNEFFN